MTSKSKTPAAAIDAAVVLMRLSGQREALEQTIREQAQQTLRLGGTWRTIGAALGVSPQAAWERYRPTTEHAQSPAPTLPLS